ncbi:MAG: type I 3-dehydroquinate dehydratase [Desulfobacterales bacterium]|nr:type I 3-dehydroquinate dehydratase [Desulfobacterales bacterium]
MRQQSEIQVTVRDSVIGGPLPLVCLPLVGDTRAKVLQEAEALVNLEPDLLEWRIDGYEHVEDMADCLSLLKEMRTIIGDTALIFTCRIDVEGGMCELSRETRLNLNSEAIKSGDIDIIDIELCNDRQFIDTIKDHTQKNGVKLILSYHNFVETPSEQIIYDKLVEAQTTGADISKFAAMPQNYGDVLSLFNATQKARNGAVQVPIVAMSMGPIGAVSRIAGGLFGSDITFGIGMQASAPGQIPIQELRSGMALLYEE